MYCPECGFHNAPQVFRCGQCNGLLPRGPVVREASIEESAGMRMLLPVGRSWWALAAGYLGLVSLLLIPAPFALFCGIVGIVDIRRNPHKHGMGRCLLGVIAGGLMTLLLILMIGSMIFARK